MKWKSLTSKILAILLAVLSATQTFAITPPKADNSEVLGMPDNAQDIPLTLSAEPMTFSVSLPSSFPVSVDSSNNVYTADNAKIVNNSSAPVAVTNVQFEEMNGWTLSDWDSYKPAQDSLALLVHSVKSTGGNSNDFTPDKFPAIPGNGGEFNLSYDAKLPVLYDALSVQPASVIFTIGWSNEANESPPISTSPEIPFVNGRYEITTLPDGDVTLDFSVQGTGGSWSSSNDSVITVVPDTGSATIVGNGETTIDYTSPDLDFSVDVSVDLPQTTFGPGQIADNTYLAEIVLNKLEVPANEIKVIEFVKSLPTSITKTVNISNNTSKKVLVGTDGQTLYISSEGEERIYSPENASKLFGAHPSAEESICFINVTEFHNLSMLDTSKTTNMSSFFCRMESLTSLDLSSFDTSRVKSMNSMFHYCKSLETLNISSLDTSAVTDMSCMFWGCESIRELDLSHFDTSTVTGMDSMFRNCYSLRRLYIPFDTRSCRGMSYMFGNCSQLTSLNLSTFDTSNVTSMWGMFRGCSSLNSIDLGNFDTSKVIYMAYMFGECDSLTILDVSNFMCDSATSIYHMFAYCESLQTLYVPSGVSSVDDVDDALNLCNNLKTVYCTTEMDKVKLENARGTPQGISFIVKP